MKYQENVEMVGCGSGAGTEESKTGVKKGEVESGMYQIWVLEAALQHFKERSIFARICW